MKMIIAIIIRTLEVPPPNIIIFFTCVIFYEDLVIPIVIWNSLCCHHWGVFRIRDIDKDLSSDTYIRFGFKGGDWDLEIYVLIGKGLVDN